MISEEIEKKILYKESNLILTWKFAFQEYSNIVIPH